MKLTPATRKDARTIRELHRSVLGTEGCTWNEDYPGDLELFGDLGEGRLFIWGDESRMIGAVSLVEPRELDEFECLHPVADACEFARVVISPAMQGRGEAGKMLTAFLQLMKDRGFGSVNISVAKCNHKARRLYEHLGFTARGEVFLYGHDFFLMKKILRKPGGEL